MANILIKELAGIGKKIGKKIQEILDTGKLDKYEAKSIYFFHPFSSHFSQKDWRRQMWTKELKP